ncbi:hypothetical protein KHC28_19685 [Ancylobacter sonchi]|uniref:hypothetical protein n=1 Tax=Ancylobacter sonchi TaxID=1937790 RepID=UPI001BD318FC|nr:hypothetical protein [Ancylobacter sonchi]MBS7535878.1 hypothetical protein [Ancylobacter sonchi]
MLAVICIKWGEAYPAEDVNVLYQGVRDHLSEPFRFICLTDRADGLRPEVETADLPGTGALNLRWRGCWPKLGMFAPGLLEGVDLALYLDLDVVILRPLDPIVAHARATPGLHILREWNPNIWEVLPVSLRPDRGAQSSMVAWRPGEQDHLYLDTMADPDAAYALAKNDQVYIGVRAHRRHYFPEGFAVSFRRHCVPHWPLNVVFRTARKPSRVPLVVFHGVPKPSEVARADVKQWGTRNRPGFGPVDWVRTYWERGLDGSRQAIAADEAQPRRSASHTAS